MNRLKNLSIVYVLSNPAMPGLIKIGRTSQEDVAVRLAQLYTTGVPVPFKLEFACKVENPEEVENALHIAFSSSQPNPKREFFAIDPSQAIAILKLLHTEDATQEVAMLPSGIDVQSIVAGEKLKSKRPPLNFEEMGIPSGAKLDSTKADIFVSVVGPKKVSLDGEELSLTAATRKVLQIDYSVAPGPFWTHNGKLIQDIYNETYAES
ncbi:GIY-YIG nuclease family protein [Inhella sp. 4Y17]|uniref:GIY-YIG nuclease family protein n=1 Tax=Inhella gelatinilytica TaxID=2795030 RepID=A0A931IW74_9BURK|nr:GIY-YIG nuclease family protein [Inhella gelatinilytica]